jgi:hypothetical protein
MLLYRFRRERIHYTVNLHLWLLSSDFHQVLNPPVIAGFRHSGAKHLHYLQQDCFQIPEKAVGFELLIIQPNHLLAVHVCRYFDLGLKRAIVRVCFPLCAILRTTIY